MDVRRRGASPPWDTLPASTTIRPHDHSTDDQTVIGFLVDVSEPGDTFGMWLPPRWEYMHAHEYTKTLPVERFGVAEEDGRVAGIVRFDHAQAFVPENRVSPAEPVATDSDFRRMGLAQAAVSETLRRVADLGADVA